MYPATTSISTLSLHDALPISRFRVLQIDINGAELLRDDADKCIGPALPPSANDCLLGAGVLKAPDSQRRLMAFRIGRSEEHTSELQSLRHLVCRLLLEKNKTN